MATVSTSLALLSLLLVQLSSSKSINQHNNDDSLYVDIPSSCNLIDEDGLYYIKPTLDGSIIPVICSNGYTMIDLSLDLNLESYPSYLTSWSYSRNSKEWVIPSLDDISSFKEWWIPSSLDEDTQFRVAKGCLSCDTSIDFGDDVVYYADSSYFCFASTPIPGCTSELNEYACNICDVGTKLDDTSRIWTKCSAIEMKSDTPIIYDHDQCVTHGLTYRPVMNTVRGACNCYKPSTDSDNIYQVSIDELPVVTWPSEQQPLKALGNLDPNIIIDRMKGEDVKPDCSQNIVYLTNDDFKYGTYRIQECGEYILNEDIIINMNAPDEDIMNDPDFSPNTIDDDELYWFPTHEQDINGDYPGLYSYAGSYSLGFFAGITVETDNVIINLNGYSMSMDRVFYLQQRYFTLIECGAKYFLPNQGPSNWQIAGEYYASHLEIKGPGILGLSSHHAIHGMRNEHLNIHDIEITNFEVAGIQCNGCNNVIIDSCTVGPQNTDIPVLGRYAHARAMLPRYKELNDEYGDEQITFYNREPIKISDLCQRIIDQMDMIYNNYINDIQYDDDDEEWIAAKKLFYNPTGWMDGGSSYGVVFNGDGAAVVGMGSRIKSTTNIKVSNVEIYGIYNQVLEKIKVSINKVGASRLLLFDTIDWIAVTDSIEDGSTAQYIGDSYTDLIFAIKKNIDSWSYLNSLYLTDAEQQYVFEGNNEENNAFRGIWEGGSPAINDQSATGCNTDIQLHSSKGAIGLRFDGTQNIDISDIYIHDVINWADLGGNWCGLNDGPSVSNEDLDIQYGYTGTRAHGLIIDYVTGNMQNINIQNIESYHGEAIGINIYKGCDVNINGDINIDTISAGSQLNDDDVQKLTLPNLIPRACAINIHDDTVVTFDIDDEDMVQNNVNGYDIDNCINNDTDDQDTDDNEDQNVIGIGFDIIIAAVIVFVALCFGIIIKYYGYSKRYYKYNNGDVDNENTPLLP